MSVNMCDANGNLTRVDGTIGAPEDITSQVTLGPSWSVISGGSWKVYKYGRIIKISINGIKTSGTSGYTTILSGLPKSLGLAAAPLYTDDFTTLTTSVAVNSTSLLSLASSVIANKNIYCSFVYLTDE